MDYQLGPGPLQVDQNTIDEKIKGDIGIVENGDVATHTIPNGYYVIWKGDLYVAKTDISSGTTLSAESNGNLTAKSNGLGGEVAALNSKIKTATIPASRLNTKGGSGYWFYAERSNITDLIPTSATILSVFRGNWDSSNDGVPYAYGNVIGIVFTSAKSANDVGLRVTYM